MYYRVASQVDSPPTWRWISTVLTSLEALFWFLRLYRGLSQDHLRVFSSSSREDLEEQLVQENKGLGSNSVTAAQFQQERLIRSPEVVRGASACAGREDQVTLSIGVSTTPVLSERNIVEHTLRERSLSAPEKRRFEMEMGSGGDYDLPYTFTGPSSMPQVLAWVRLLARVQNGQLPS